MNGQHSNANDIICEHALPSNPEKGGDTITSTFREQYTQFLDESNKIYKNITKEHIIKTERQIPRLGLMMVGLGGNNGSTLTAGILAHKHNICWETKTGTKTPTFYGSFTQCTTARVGVKVHPNGGIEDVYVPVKELLPMVNPVDLEISGWDISSLNMYESCKRA